MLVLVLAGLATALVGPFLFSTLDRISGKSEIRKVASTMRYARSRAISEKTRVSFYADIDENAYWLTVPQKEGERGKEDDELRNGKSRVFPLGASVRIIEFSDKEETVDQGKFFIVFYPQGNTSGGRINFQMKTREDDDELHYNLTLDPVTGKPKIEEITE